VTFQIKGQPSPYGVYKISTFNTSENEKNVFWIKEDFQVKAEGDDDLTFSLLDGKDIAGSYNLTSLTGKIFPKLGHSKTGNVTDSIYMEFVYEGDTDVYTIKGHKRTRWPEDDY